MREILTYSLDGGIALFVFISSLNLGLDLTAKQIVEPLRNKRLLMSSLIANFILIPIIAIILTMILPLDNTVIIGILLYAACAGNKISPKFVQIAKGNTAFAVALLGVLAPLAIIGVPLILSLGLPDMHIQQDKLLLSLIVVVALPLALGLFIKVRNDGIAIRTSTVLHRISLPLLGILLVQVIYVRFDMFMALQSNALIIGLLFFALSFTVGYLMGGPEKENRRTLAIMTFMRAGAFSMMIAEQAFAHDQRVLVMATVMTSLSVMISVPTVFWLGNSSTRCVAKSVNTNV